jgi:hypothetical protein
MTIQADDINDLVTDVLDNYGPVAFGQVAQELSKYIVMNQVLKKDVAKFRGGRGINRRIMIDQSKAARDVGYYDDDSLGTKDVQVAVRAPFRNTTSNFTYDVKEMEDCSGPEELTDIIEVKNVDMLLGMAEHLELAFWGIPSSTSDNTTPWGIQYWINKNATRGFNGGAPTGFSDVGGINPTTYSNWKNYTATYTAYTDESLGSELRRCWRATGFVSPVKASDIGRAEGSKHKIMCGEEEDEGIISMLRAQNDNIGLDLAEYYGKATFKKIPIQYVPAIDSVFSAGDIFFLDCNHLYPVLKSGSNFRRSKPQIVSGKHDVRAVYLDLRWNLFCTDRRRQGWIYKV